MIRGNVCSNIGSPLQRVEDVLCNKVTDGKGEKANASHRPRLNLFDRVYDG